MDVRQVSRLVCLGDRTETVMMQTYIAGESYAGQVRTGTHRVTVYRLAK